MNNMPWSFSPYKPIFFETGDIYICRISPNKNDFTAEWLDIKEEYSVFLKKRDESEFKETLKTKNNFCTIKNLEEDTDYEFYVVRDDDGARSETRLARTGIVPGRVVNYLHPDDPALAFSGQYLCSPCLIRLPSGRLLASMDVFRGNAPQNLTLIYYSDDDGQSWHYLTELFPCFWGQMFYENGRLYMLACSTEYSDLLIGKSTDGGKTFGFERPDTYYPYVIKGEKI